MKFRVKATIAFDVDADNADAAKRAAEGMLIVGSVDNELVDLGACHPHVIAATEASPNVALYRLQQEFDDEPIYIFGPEQSDDDEPIITLAPGNGTFARAVLAFLNTTAS